MNFPLTHIPPRETKVRTSGITMVMDKGLSLREAEDFCSVAADFTDYIKIGFGSAYITPHLEEKLKVYQSAGITPYFGGTLFEVFIARSIYDDFRKMVSKFNLDTVEISDGSLQMPHEEKCKYIAELSKDFRVFSEVGSKDSEVVIPPYKWIELMKEELKAGSEKVIAEAREGGNAGIFRGSGEVRSGLIEEILTEVKADDIIWEAPNKPQQVWFIKLLGQNVNLGNIHAGEVIALESLRLGLRGDTFHQYLKTE